MPPPLVPVADPENAFEATVLLTKFHPIRMSTKDLKKLLAAKADPNITLCGDIHPLLNVLTFAGANDVEAMRDLLLQAGAVESTELKERWVLRHSHDAGEAAWLRNFHGDPTLVPHF